MADASVRPAAPDDVQALAAVQRRVWRDAYADLLPPRALGAVTSVDAEAAWGAAVSDPPGPRHAVLVAVARGAAGGDDVVGLAAVAPTSDEDLSPATTSELLTLLVDVPRRREGHGARLLAAVSDLQAAAGTSLLTTWLFDADAVTQAWLGGAGWEPDGARRDLDVDGELVAMLRLHVRLAP